MKRIGRSRTRRALETLAAWPLSRESVFGRDRKPHDHRRKAALWFAFAGLLMIGAPGLWALNLAFARRAEAILSTIGWFGLIFWVAGLVPLACGAAHWSLGRPGAANDNRKPLRRRVAERRGAKRRGAR